MSNLVLCLSQTVSSEELGADPHVAFVDSAPPRSAPRNRYTNLSCLLFLVASTRQWDDRITHVILRGFVSRCIPLAA